MPMLKYRIKHLLDKYKVNGNKKTPAYREKYNEILNQTGIDSARLSRVSNMLITDNGTIPSDQLIQISEVLGVTVDELLNRQTQAV